MKRLVAVVVIALAFAGCGGAVHQTPVAKAPANHVKPPQGSGPATKVPAKGVHPSTTTSTPAQVAPASGASQHCDQTISSDPNTSCELAFNTFKAFVAKHASQ